MSVIQIGQLPQVNSINDDMQFPTETANVTQKIYATSLRDYVTSLAYLNSAGNVTAANLRTTNSTGNVYAGNVFASSALYGTLSTATQQSITQIGNLTTANVSGNITVGTLRSNVATTNSAGNAAVGAKTIAAAVFNGNTGTIAMDDSGHKRITWSDGGGHFNIRAGNYHNGTAIVYTKGAWDANSGATAITMSMDGATGAMTFNTANIAAPGTAISVWGGTIYHTPQFTQFLYKNSAGTGQTTPVAINSEPNSTAYTNGALVVTGGVGISGNLNVHGVVDMDSKLNVDGVLTAPTAAPFTNNTQVATTAWVTNYLPLKADIDSPAFTGTPSLPSGTTGVTQTAGDNTTKLATTEFVESAQQEAIAYTDLQIATRAPTASPAFSGTPSLPTGTTGVTQTAGDNSTKLSTTAFVYEANVGLKSWTTTQLSSKAPIASPTFTGTVSGITKSMVGLSNVDNTTDAGKPVSTAQQTALDLKANIASPAFTGTPSLPTGTTGVTQTTGDSSTKLATTAFVANAAAAAVPTGTILMWPTATAPSGYLKCDGTFVSRTTYAALFAVIGTTFGTTVSTDFGLPNYSNRFPIGVGTAAALAATGGTADAVVVSHTHTATTSLTDPGHSHIIRGSVSPDSKFLYSAGGGNTGIGVPFQTAAATTANVTGISVGVTNSTTGESGTGKNLPPYLGINFIIKT